MGRYTIGDRVSWSSINRDYTGTVTGFFRAFAVVKIDGTGKTVLLQNEPIQAKTFNR